MKILLSPAKSMIEEAKIIGISSMPHFLDDAQKLVNQLKILSVKELQKLMSISIELAQLNELRYKKWVKSNSTEKENLIQAIRAFNGEVFRGFDISSLEENNYNKIQNSIRILSGLYGVLRPFDLISPYRLEMGTKIRVNPNYKNLYEFWRVRLTENLCSELKKNEPVINLASSEYAKVIDFKKIKSPVINPIFKEFKNGKYSIVMMYAKHARGRMARYLIDNSLVDVVELKSYALDGYSFNDQLSTENDWVFVR